MDVLLIACTVADVLLQTVGKKIYDDIVTDIIVADTLLQMHSGRQQKLVGNLADNKFIKYSCRNKVLDSTLADSYFMMLLLQTADMCRESCRHPFI